MHWNLKSKNQFYISTKMNAQDKYICRLTGMPKALSVPPSICTYKLPEHTIENVIKEMKHTIIDAVRFENRNTYSNPLINIAIDPPTRKVIDDCISIGSENKEYTGIPGPNPVLYVHITDAVFVIDSLPKVIRDGALYGAELRTATRYNPSGTLPMWPAELIDDDIIGFPKLTRDEVRAESMKLDGAMRAPCVTFVIPYDKKTGAVDIYSSAIRYTTIVPPYSYSYMEADELERKSPGGGQNSHENHIIDILHEISKIAATNSLRYGTQRGTRRSEWLVSICMNLASMVAAYTMTREGIPALYRNQSLSRSGSVTLSSITEPVLPLKALWDDFLYEYGYTRVTCPARRLEDYINMRNLYFRRFGDDFLIEKDIKYGEMMSHCHKY